VRVVDEKQKLLWPNLFHWIIRAVFSDVCSLRWYITSLCHLTPCSIHPTLPFLATSSGQRIFPLPCSDGDSSNSEHEEEDQPLPDNSVQLWSLLGKGTGTFRDICTHLEEIKSSNYKELWLMWYYSSSSSSQVSNLDTVWKSLVWLTCWWVHIAWEYMIGWSNNKN